MRIDCPYCGSRDIHEFVYRGDATPVRPALDCESADKKFFEYVYLRKNPAGEISDHWFHASGCRRWLVVTRSTLTHEILNVMLAGKIS